MINEPKALEEFKLEIEKVRDHYELKDNEQMRRLAGELLEVHLGKKTIHDLKKPLDSKHLRDRLNESVAKWDFIWYQAGLIFIVILSDEVEERVALVIEDGRSYPTVVASDIMHYLGAQSLSFFKGWAKAVKNEER